MELCWQLAPLIVLPLDTHTSPAPRVLHLLPDYSGWIFSGVHTRTLSRCCTWAYRSLALDFTHPNHMSPLVPDPHTVAGTQTRSRRCSRLTHQDECHTWTWETRVSWDSPGKDWMGCTFHWVNKLCSCLPLCPAFLWPCADGPLMGWWILSWYYLGPLHPLLLFVT